jgi:hypothetical protein
MKEGKKIKNKEMENVILRMEMAEDSRVSTVEWFGWDMDNAL